MRRISLAFRLRNGLSTVMWRSFWPNGTPFARFCSTLERRMKPRRIGGVTVSRVRLSASGATSAGFTKRRKKKPATATYGALGSSGKRFFDCTHR